MGIEKKRNQLPISIKEVAIGSAAALTLFYFASFFAFTNNQKEALRKRDGGICQFPGCNRKTTNTLEVHHVVPQGYSFRVNNMRPDNPFNSVSLCDMHHVGYAKRNDKREELPVGFVWDPIHPDTTFASLLYSGKLKQVNPAYKRRHKEVYEFYEQKAQEVGNNPRKDAFSGVMREWRSSQLDKRKIYWNDTYDGVLQTIAITSTLEAISSGWIFPYKHFSYTTRTNTAEYAWDNIVAVLIERFVCKLDSKNLTRILSRIQKDAKPSRIVYYEEIYTPAVAGYENQRGVVGLLNRYINTLSKIEYSALIKEFNSETNRERAFNILIENFYNRAIQKEKLGLAGSQRRSTRRNRNTNGVDSPSVAQSQSIANARSHRL